MKAKTASPETAMLTAERKLHNTWVYIKRHWQLYLLFLLPAVVLTLVFKYAPMGGVLIAFQKYNPFRGIWGSEWVGFKNFTRFMSSPDFQRYLLNTQKLSVYGLLWGFPIPILLAFLLNRIESKKIKQKVQLVLYMPNFISVIVLCGIVRVLLSVTGPVNGLLHTSINFMTLPEAFRPIYIISGIWQGAGWASIMYTASLSNASKDLKEAAMIDGANLIQQIMTVEWPAIKDMVVIQFILQAGNIMSIGFEKAYGSYKELLDDPEVEAVYIALPNTLHYEWGVKAMKSGKHVLCEKPLAPCEKQVKELYETAKENHVYLMEAFAYQHSPYITAIKKEIEDETIGEVCFLDSAFIT